MLDDVEPYNIPVVGAPAVVPDAPPVEGGLPAMPGPFLQHQ